MNILPVILITCAQVTDISVRVQNSQRLTPEQKHEIIQIMRQHAPQCKIFEGKK